MFLERCHLFVAFEGSALYDTAPDPLTFFHKRALSAQIEGSGLAKRPACLSGRQSHLNKLQYAYVSHKMISFKNAFLPLISLKSVNGFRWIGFSIE